MKLEYLNVKALIRPSQKIYAQKKIDIKQTLYGLKKLKQLIKLEIDNKKLKKIICNF